MRPTWNFVRLTRRTALRFGAAACGGAVLAGATRPRLVCAEEAEEPAGTDRVGNGSIKEPHELNKSLASVPGDVPGVHTDIVSLKRSKGGMLTMRVAFVNDSGAPVKAKSFPGTGSPALDSITLIDYGSGRKYKILCFQDSTCLCNTYHDVSEQFPSGTTPAWAKFTAPPASVKTITVLFSGGEPIDDVPIS